MLLREPEIIVLNYVYIFNCFHVYGSLLCSFPYFMLSVSGSACAVIKADSTAYCIKY